MTWRDDWRALSQDEKIQLVGSVVFLVSLVWLVILIALW
jgi:hypothetical protein